MKKLLAILIAAVTMSAQADITGAGATFPFPIYAKWAEGYKKATGHSLNYQSIGSSGGIRQINARTVDFGATDAPVKGEDLDKQGQVQFPAIIGGTVPVVNLDGIKPGELKITGPVMADVFMGNQAKTNGTATSGARKLGSLLAYITTNVSKGSAGTNPTGDGSDIRNLQDEILRELGR